MKWFWITLAILLGMIASSACGGEVGRVVAVNGVSFLVLEDGREVGVLGIDVTGLSQAEHRRAKAWMEVMVLERTVEFREQYKTGFGRVAGVPVWNEIDVTGTLLKMGLVRLEKTRVTQARLKYWQQQVQVAQKSKLGLWKNYKEVETPQVRAVRPYVLPQRLFSLPST